MQYGVRSEIDSGALLVVVRLPPAASLSDRVGNRDSRFRRSRAGYRSSRVLRSVEALPRRSTSRPQGPFRDLPHRAFWSAALAGPRLQQRLHQVDQVAAGVFEDDADDWAHVGRLAAESDAGGLQPLVFVLDVAGQKGRGRNAGVE